MTWVVILQVRAKLPICFGRERGPRMEKYVMLRDPKNNEIEVRLEKKDEKVYFVNGWFGLRDFYHLNLGAWIDLTYENPRLLTMVVKNRFYEEIAYPNNTPPIISKLDRRAYGGNKISFHNTLTVILTESDVSTGYLVKTTYLNLLYIEPLIMYTRLIFLKGSDNGPILFILLFQVLSWYGFCQHHLSKNKTELTVIDYMGFEWKCEFRFVQRIKTLCCRLGGDWGKICKARRFLVRSRFELVVMNERDNDVVYLKYIPRSSDDGEFPKGLDRMLCLQADAVVFNLKG